MLIVMKKSATEEQKRFIKQYLVDHDFDFHQSTGANRTIIGVIGNTTGIELKQLEALAGVHVVFKIPEDS